jgi:hypothetical protein
MIKIQIFSLVLQEIKTEGGVSRHCGGEEESGALRIKTVAAGIVLNGCRKCFCRSF